MHLFHESLWKPVNDQQVKERPKHFFKTDTFFLALTELAMRTTEHNEATPCWQHMQKTHKPTCTSSVACTSHLLGHWLRMTPFCQALYFWWSWSQVTWEYKIVMFWKPFLSVFWTLRRCRDLLLLSDLFLAAPLFRIPFRGQTGGHCQRLTQHVDFKFLQIILSTVVMS